MNSAAQAVDGGAMPAVRPIIHEGLLAMQATPRVPRRGIRNGVIVGAVPVAPRPAGTPSDDDELERLIAEYTAAFEAMDAAFKASDDDDPLRDEAMGREDSAMEALLNYRPKDMVEVARRSRFLMTTEDYRVGFVGWQITALLRSMAEAA